MFVCAAHAEADTFFCFQSLMVEIGDHFTKNLDGAHTGIGIATHMHIRTNKQVFRFSGGTMRKLMKLLREKDPSLHKDMVRLSRRSNKIPTQTSCFHFGCVRPRKALTPPSTVFAGSPYSSLRSSSYQASRGYREERRVSNNPYLDLLTYRCHSYLGLPVC